MWRPATADNMGMDVVTLLETERTRREMLEAASELRDYVLQTWTTDRPLTFQQETDKHLCEPE
jgi:hypothetical protein